MQTTAPIVFDLELPPPSLLAARQPEIGVELFVPSHHAKVVDELDWLVPLSAPLSEVPAPVPTAPTPPALLNRLRSASTPAPEIDGLPWWLDPTQAENPYPAPAKEPVRAADPRKAVMLSLAAAVFAALITLGAFAFTTAPEHELMVAPPPTSTEHAALTHAAVDPPMPRAPKHW